MKKILKIKIITDDFQYRALLGTMNMFNVIQNEISSMAFEQKEFRNYHVHKLSYRSIKEKYSNYSSQLIIRAIDNVACSYKNKGVHTKFAHGFKKTSAVVYDERILTIYDDTISIWTVEGRLKKIPIIVHNRELFNLRKGQCDLVLSNGQFYLMCTIDVPESELTESKDVIGVDLGINKIATVSDGTVYSGDQIKKKRLQYHDHRSRLQKCGTRSAHRRIKSVGKRESRFRKDVNHCISKELVEKAKGTSCALALEELKGINSRTTVRKSQRNERLSWSFYQLRSFIEYKAKEAGVQVLIVPSPYTSQTCSDCGHCEKKNRRNQSEFSCLSCGFSMNADLNASKNIRNLGLQSINLLFAAHAACNKPTTLVVGS
jgi:IS605 OrfB family transposase